MILKDLRDNIRADCGIKGPSSMIGYMNELINSTLREYTGMGLYDQLYFPGFLFSPSGSYDYSVLNLQHIIEDQVYWSEDGTGTDKHRLLKKAPGLTNSGQPRTYFLVGNFVSLFPNADIDGSVSLLYINGYKYPTTLLNDTDVFPINSLIMPVRHKCVQLVARLDKTQLARLAKKDAEESYSASLSPLGSPSMTPLSP